jgi:hypothetical protein
MPPSSYRTALNLITRFKPVPTSSGFSVILIGEFEEAIHFRTNENLLYKRVSDYRSGGSIHDVIHDL